MVRVQPPPTPIGLAELLAGTIAVLFALLAAGWLVVALAQGHLAEGASPAAGADAGSGPGTCAYAPDQPIPMRLGDVRAYPAPIDIQLDPAGFATTPTIAGTDAYRLSGLKVTACHSDELLAFYTSSSPAINHVLAWVFVTSLDCPSDTPRPASAAGGPAALVRQCVSITSVDAGSGALMGTRMFLAPPQ